MPNKGAPNDEAKFGMVQCWVNRIRWKTAEVTDAVKVSVRLCIQEWQSPHGSPNAALLHAQNRLWNDVKVQDAP